MVMTRQRDDVLSRQHHNDVLSGDEDFVFDPVLDPSLVATATTKRKAAAVTAAGPQRGRAWREKDSILLVKAFEWVEDTRKSMCFLYFYSNKRLGVAVCSRRQNVQTLVGPRPRRNTSDSVIGDCTLEGYGLDVQVLLSHVKFIAYCRFIVSFNDNKIFAQPAVQSGFSCLTSSKTSIFKRGPKATRKKPKR
jgi:hypothetical protein